MAKKKHKYIQGKYGHQIYTEVPLGEQFHMTLDDSLSPTFKGDDLLGSENNASISTLKKAQQALTSGTDTFLTGKRSLSEKIEEIMKNKSIPDHFKDLAAEKHLHNFYQNNENAFKAFKCFYERFHKIHHLINSLKLNINAVKVAHKTSEDCNVSCKYKIPEGEIRSYIYLDLSYNKLSPELVSILDKRDNQPIPHITLLTIKRVANQSESKKSIEDDEIDVVGLYKIAVDKLVTKLEIDILGNKRATPVLNTDFNQVVAEEQREQKDFQASAFAEDFNDWIETNVHPLFQPIGDWLLHL